MIWSGDQVSIFGFDVARLDSTDAAMADINRLILDSVKKYAPESGY